jgi:hypothetical protein
VAANQVLRDYRLWLYGTGGAEGLDEAGRPLRRGFGADEVRAVLASKGWLDRWKMLRCRVRYLTDGVAIGTRNFVNAVFAARREHFGANRASGARPMRGVEAASLFTMRDLRVRALG